MKIVHINTATEGGAAEAALRLHSALLHLHADSNFLALYKAQCSVNKVYDFRDELGLIDSWICKIKNKLTTTKTKKDSLQAGELFSDITSVWKLQKHSLFTSANILHFHWVSGFINIPEVLAFNKHVVWTLHDHFLFSGGFHYPPVSNGVISQEILINQKNTIAEAIKKHPISIVCPSLHLTELAKNSGVLDGCSFYTIKNAVDLSQFRPGDKNTVRKKLKINENETVLFFISDLIDYSRKGFEHLEKALLKMEKNTTLLVAGKGKLPAKIGRVKIKQYGFIRDKSLLNDLYNASDLLVNPSLNDISSNTIIEAMACGIPVVAYNSGGIPELITEENGIVVNKKDPEELAKAIITALNKKYNSELIRKKAEAEHAPELIASKYMEVYQKELQRPTS